MPQSQRPAGTVTFLFTDIEGSTKLWEAHPEAMRSSLARHDTLMREAIASSGGYVFKTIGDAFCAAFATASDAVHAVLAAQLSLAAEPWPDETPIRVRMALHTGAVESRDDDYFGQPVNRVARLLSTAHGGQMIVSAATQELVRDDLPQGASLQGLGEHRLKDLGRPEGIFQLFHPDLPSDFPPLRSLDSPELRHNLPLQVTSFVGRESQIAEVKGLMEKTRLVTLTGSGGSGKTRLSLQVAAEMLDGSGDGVWLVELAPLTDPNLVPSTVADVLGVREESVRPITETLKEHLKNKFLLLILDNCEHLLDACAKLADSLLRNCPRVLILATSREGLGISGEQAYRVPSLSLPDPKQAQTAEALGHYESVRLFVDRAVLAKSDFQVTNQNAPALASVCHRLDGIPLAIELAAARVRSLTIEDINSKLDQRFRLLTGGSRTALPRQQTLRSLIDWSYDLLNDVEKAFLSRLSVFAGGWTLDAAESVCSGDPVEAWETLDLLASLCDKSLVVSESHDHATRYRLLETVRQYARDRLLERGEGTQWRDRHLTCFTELAEEAEPCLRGSEEQKWLERLETEHDNFRAALEWSQGPSSESDPTTTANAVLGLRMAGCLMLFWLNRGHLAEGRDWLDRASSKRLVDNLEVRAKALYGAGAIAVGQWDHLAARSFLEEALELWREAGDRSGIAASLCSLGNLALGQADYSVARLYYEESLATSRELGNKQGVVSALNNLACLELAQDDHARATTTLQECLALSRDLGHQTAIAGALASLGRLAKLRGDYADARKLWSESLKIYLELGSINSIPNLLDDFADLHAILGEPGRGSHLWGAAERLRERTGGSASPQHRAQREQAIVRARDALGDEGPFDAAWQAGREMTMEQAIELALEGLDA